MLLTQDDLRRLSVEEKGELVRRQILYGDVHVEGMTPGRRGYVTIGAADGSVRQAHYTKAHTEVYAPGSIRVDPDKPVTWNAVPLKQQSFDVAFTQKAAQKRTFQQRLDSMTKRYVDSWRKGLMSDGVLRQIEGEYWKAGLPITAERLRAIAGRALNEARNRQVRG